MTPSLFSGQNFVTNLSTMTAQSPESASIVILTSKDLTVKSLKSHVILYANTAFGNNILPFMGFTAFYDF